MSDTDPEPSCAPKPAQSDISEQVIVKLVRPLSGKQIPYMPARLATVQDTARLHDLFNFITNDAYLSQVWFTSVGSNYYQTGRKFERIRVFVTDSQKQLHDRHFVRKGYQVILDDDDTWGDLLQYRVPEGERKENGIPLPTVEATIYERAADAWVDSRMQLRTF